MTNSPSDRLDRLEATLTRFAELQIQNSLRHDQAIASLEEQTRQNSLAIAQLTERVNTLSNNVNTLSAEMAHLVGVIANYIVESEADREIFKQNQAEIRRIWEYLFRQNPNGRGEG